MEQQKRKLRLPKEQFIKGLDQAKWAIGTTNQEDGPKSITHVTCIFASGQLKAWVENRVNEDKTTEIEPETIKEMVASAKENIYQRYLDGHYDYMVFPWNQEQAPEGYRLLTEEEITGDVQK
jgi:hypothetical protein